MKILFVCLGNICRSPMAETLLRKKTQDLSLDWEIDSAGMMGFLVGHGSRPSRTGGDEEKWT